MACSVRCFPNRSISIIFFRNEEVPVYTNRKRNLCCWDFLLLGRIPMEYWDGIAKINLLGTLSERILSIQVRVGKRVKTKRA